MPDVNEGNLTGAGLQSKRWFRRCGWALLACGLFITALMAVAIYSTAPLIGLPN